MAKIETRFAAFGRETKRKKSSVWLRKAFLSKASFYTVATELVSVPFIFVCNVPRKSERQAGLAGWCMIGSYSPER